MTSLFDFLDDSNDERAEGERLRDEAFARLEHHRPYLITRLQCAFVKHLLTHGPSTSDPIRQLVPIPVGTDPRVVGCAVQLLARQHRLTKSIDSDKTYRKIAHARRLQVWAITDEARARNWYSKHSATEPTQSIDPDDP